MLEQDVGDHQGRVVCCNIEYLNFGMQNLRLSNVKVIFQRPFCNYPCTKVCPKIIINNTQYFLNCNQHFANFNPSQVPGAV